MRFLIHPIIALAAWLLLAWPVPAACEDTVLVVPKAESVQFWGMVRQGAMDAGVGRGVRVLYRGPLAHESDERQRAIIEQGLAEGVDAVVIAPSSVDALTDVTLAARDKGVPLVVIDSALGDGWQVSFVATDNLEAGRVAARFLLSSAPGGGTILLLRHKAGSSATEKREVGFAAEVEADGRHDILLSDYLGVSQGNAYHRTMSLLRDHPEINGVFASGEVATMGCIRAVRELGLMGRVKVVGFDDTPDIRRALEDGILQGVMVQQPYQMGLIGVETACDALAGRPVKKRIVTEAVLVTSSEEFESYFLTNP
ncbi:substrate-binding domain-containing protein [Pseudodesulfovibrio indicus]|uniref:substrate-binding domain-containing protein n=1 Tax=Pseudodesulfovibrio indicus TaxID=1716143 RepID=UPI0029310399|nr:substrate-binding domain-containing protein [Pseudodesulfovibrio indicus]